MKDVLKSLFYENLKYLGWILLFFVLWLRGCSGTSPKPQLAKVIVPEIKGKFEAKKPIVIHDTFTINKYIKGKNILVKEFIYSTDTVKIKMYQDAVQLKNFASTFENDTIKIDINGVVQGEVKEITPTYNIKERKVELQVKPKETIFRLLGGLELGNNVKLDRFAAKANLMLQNRKGGIISGSFDNNKTIWIGYNFSIFDIKR